MFLDFLYFLNFFHGFLVCSSFSAWGNLGNVLKNQGKVVEAEQAYRNALYYRRNMADMLYNLWVSEPPPNSRLYRSVLVKLRKSPERPDYDCLQIHQPSRGWCQGPTRHINPTVRAWRHFIHNSYTAHVWAVLSYPFKAVGMGILRHLTSGSDFNSGSCDVITKRFSMHLILTQCVSLEGQILHTTCHTVHGMFSCICFFNK